MTQFARTLVLLLALPSFAATTAPYLVKDLPGPIDARGSLGSFWVTIDNTSWFTAYTGDALGTQVWKTDGTEGGTVRVTSVLTDGVHAETFVGALNGHIFYGGHDGHGDALIVLDANGAPPLTLAQSLFGERGVVYNGALYAPANARADGGALKGFELWRTDGTLEGTTFADLNPGPASSLSAQSLVLAGDWMIFAGETTAGKGIYRTDGTAAGTSLLLALPAGRDPREALLTQFGNRVVFVFRNPGVDNDQLWVTDGTEDGTQPIVERMSTFTGGATLDGRFLFTMKTPGGQITMWTTNGTMAGTQQLNDHKGSFGTVGVPGAVVDGKYFFFGLDPQTLHSALFTTGALPGTTQKVTDLDTLRTGGVARNGRFIFANRDASHGTEWWVSDGTLGGTHIIADFAAGSRDGVVSEQLLIRPDGILAGIDGPAGHEPWILDASAAGSRLLKNIAVDTPLPGSNPEELRAVGIRLFFLADAPGHRVVGRSDGYSGGTTTDVITSTDEWWFADTFVSGGRYYLHSTVLLSTDGTARGTEHLSLNAGAAVALRNGVVFEEKTDNAFRFSDGTVAGTNVIETLAGFPADGWKLYAANDHVWFTNGSSLAVSDGFSPMRRILPASGTIGTIREVVEGPNATYFTDEFLDERRLWRTDGSNAGTRIVRTFTQFPQDFIALPDKLLFTQNLLLWSTDGTEPNTVLLGAPGPTKNCVSGTGSEPLVVGNQLFWYARRNNGTAALWKSNGTLVGTAEVATFASSSPGCVTMATLEGRIYFRGFDTAHGAEPWVTDGTSAGTRLLVDLYPGTKSSDPQELTTAGPHLFFSAETPDRGRELWAIRQLTRRRGEPLMRIALMRIAFVFVLALAMPLHAADLELGFRHLSMSPRGDGAFDGGELEVVSSRGFGATAEVFWTPRISTQLAATFLNPAAFLYPANPPPNDLDLATFGIDTYSLAARYHFAPDRRISAFAGAGGALVLLGNLDDRFADQLEMTFDRETALLVEGGIRYRVLPNVIIDAAVSYMPLEAKPKHVRNETTVALPASVKLDPLTMSVGAAWRF